MLFSKPLTEAEKLTLSDAHKYHPLSWTRIRAHCILLSSQHYQVTEIAAICDISRQAVSTAIHNWEAIGFLGLVDEHRSGRPKAITEQKEAELIHKITESPRSLKKVLSDFSDAFKIDLSLSTVRRLCKKYGFSWKRVRKSLTGIRNEDEYQLSKSLVNELVMLHKKCELDLYYFDEARFSLTPCVPYAWQKIGEHIEIPTAHSQSLNVLGFVNKECDFESFVFTGPVTTEVVISCFDKFSEKVGKSGKLTVVVVDNAPVHRSDLFDKKTVDWCEQGLIVFPISKYSPELNIIEILWRKLKYDWMPFSAYQSFENLREELYCILRGIGTDYRVNFC